MHRPISVGLSYMHEPEFNRAVLPLLESGDIDALEWSFDTIGDQQALPAWMRSLLKAYSDESRLYAHGVYYSLLAGSWAEKHQAWLKSWQAIQEVFSFRHISEHFGFMTSRHAHRGCPLPVPLNKETLDLGWQRLAALKKISAGPVGVENLAFAFSKENVLSHGDFLRQLVEPVGGFIVLDLHNVYCQSVNFEMDMRTLIASYPLERVRELHLSGGSWAKSEHAENLVRRDTHDDAIPAQLLDLLPHVIAQCPNLEVIFVERLGDTFSGLSEEAGFREQFLQVKKIVALADHRRVPDWPFFANMTPDDLRLHNNSLRLQQQDILRILSESRSAPAAKEQMQQCRSLAAWNTDQWQLPMIDTAIQLGKKWGIEMDEL